METESWLVHVFESDALLVGFHFSPPCHAVFLVLDGGGFFVHCSFVHCLAWIASEMMIYALMLQALCFCFLSYLFSFPFFCFFPFVLVVNSVVLVASLEQSIPCPDSLKNVLPCPDISLSVELHTYIS